MADGSGRRPDERLGIDPETHRNKFRHSESQHDGATHRGSMHSALQRSGPDRTEGTAGGSVGNVATGGDADDASHDGITAGRIEFATIATEAELDEQLRANELAARRLLAERAVLIGVFERRGLFGNEHRSMSAYLRATVNCSTGSARRDRRFGRLIVEHPAVGDALAAGHITADAVAQIGRVHANERLRDWMPVIVPVLLERAEHTSHREFCDEVDNLVAQLDADGAFDALADSVERRRATVAEVGGTLIVSASGGDPVQATQLQAVFESFCEREFRRDVHARRQEFGDQADQHPLPRTASQRCFDALVEIFAAAAATLDLGGNDDDDDHDHDHDHDNGNRSDNDSGNDNGMDDNGISRPVGDSLPEPVVNLVVDADTAQHALAMAGLMLPSGDVLELDDLGDERTRARLLESFAADLADDPERLLDRRCHTANGTPIHPAVIVQALLGGHVRRVVMDSQGTVIDFGVRRRLFTGAARAAALLSTNYCEHPGCTIRARWSQVDHNREFSAGGTTDQRNRNIECRHHNVFKHQAKLHIRRDRRGRAYTVTADGTIKLPVGERAPDLHDERPPDIPGERPPKLTA